MKSILRTPFLAHIKSRAKDAKLVLVTTPSLHPALESEFGPQGFTIESFKLGAQSFLDTALSFFGRAGFYSGMNAIQQRREWYLGRGRIHPAIKRVFSKIVGRRHAFTFLLRALDSFVPTQDAVAALFDRYKPDIVFSTVLMYGSVDIPLLREAKRRGIYTLAMTRSWDNLTGWGYIRVVPDRFLAQNEFLVDVGEQFQHLDRRAMQVIGIPHYDLYLDRSLYQSRGEYCREMGLDPAKKIITYGAVGEPLFEYEGEMADILVGLVDNKRIPFDAQIVFRPHPAYFQEKRTGSFKDVTIDDRDLDSVPHLVNVLRHSDVLVTAGSTLIIDCACFDRPIVTVAFDGKTDARSPWYSTARFYEYFDHLRAVFRKAPGARIAHNVNELAEEVTAYLEEPSRDREERKSIVEHFASPFDGRASERLAEAILSA